MKFYQNKTRASRLEVGKQGSFIKGIWMSLVIKKFLIVFLAKKMSERYSIIDKLALNVDESMRHCTVFM